MLSQHSCIANHRDRDKRDTVVVVRGDQRKRSDRLGENSETDSTASAACAGDLLRLLDRSSCRCGAPCEARAR